MKFIIVSDFRWKNTIVRLSNVVNNLLSQGLERNVAFKELNHSKKKSNFCTNNELNEKI